MAFRYLPEFLPMNQGFDSYYGIPYSNDMDSKTNHHNTSDNLVKLKACKSIFKKQEVMIITNQKLALFKFP